MLNEGKYSLNHHLKGDNSLLIGQGTLFCLSKIAILGLNLGECKISIGLLGPDGGALAILNMTLGLI